MAGLVDSVPVVIANGEPTPYSVQYGLAPFTNAPNSKFHAVLTSFMSPMHPDHARALAESLIKFAAVADERRKSQNG